MAAEFWALTGMALVIGFTHVLLGPDHYVPFIALSKAGKWNLPKTIWITFLCGTGHILSSVIIGMIGLALGFSVLKLSSIESSRGEIAGWLLIIFGFSYFIIALFKTLKSKSKTRKQFFAWNPEQIDDPSGEESSKNSKKIGWILFILFVLGPCEPLIPLLMVPAAENNLFTAVFVTLVFGITTIATMLGIVIASWYGLSKFTSLKLEKFAHPIAGFTVLLCGAAIVFWGL